MNRTGVVEERGRVSWLCFACKRRENCAVGCVVIRLGVRLYVCGKASREGFINWISDLVPSAENFMHSPVTVDRQQKNASTRYTSSSFTRGAGRCGYSMYCIANHKVLGFCW